MLSLLSAMELKMARTIGWLKTPGAQTGVKMATSKSRGDPTCVALKTWVCNLIFLYQSILKQGTQFITCLLAKIYILLKHQSHSKDDFVNVLNDKVSNNGNYKLFPNRTMDVLLLTVRPLGAMTQHQLVHPPQLPQLTCGVKSPGCLLIWLVTSDSMSGASQAS